MELDVQIYIFFQSLKVPLEKPQEDTNIYVLDEREPRYIGYRSEEHRNAKQLMDLIYFLIYEKLPDNMSMYSIYFLEYFVKKFLIYKIIYM